ncbi:Aste57867_965 [Aphanomyces stellatus]|uniref:Aste57867_965 protein n=1 Tax=Aphanomyces stellatus TaxID=120398 RepID=A0A485K582_9STRA|nr:hypothetical protein As57867_000964 [Aphanomyces stellatus]VFT78187.1 Aste57867_965 [Aphanomyces stellatus]
MVPSKRLTAAHKQLLAMKMCSDDASAHVLSPSVSSEWRSKYLGKLRINNNMSSMVGVPRDGRADTDPSSLRSCMSAPIMIPSKTRSSSLEDPTLLSWEQPHVMNMTSPPPTTESRQRSRSTMVKADIQDIDLDVGLFPMGSPEDDPLFTHVDHDDLDDSDDDDEDDDDAFVMDTSRRRRGFIPPHQLVQRDCFSLGIQHQFRKRPTGAAAI